MGQLYGGSSQNSFQEGPGIMAKNKPGSGHEKVIKTHEVTPDPNGNREERRAASKLGVVPKEQPPPKVNPLTGKPVDD